MNIEQIYDFTVNEKTSEDTIKQEYKKYFLNLILVCKTNIEIYRYNNYSD